MTGRSLRWRSVVVLLVLVLLAVVAACGNEADKTTSTTRKVSGTTRTTATSEAGRAAERLVGTALAVSEETPSEYVDAVGQGRPVVLVFYVAGNADDTKVLEALDRLRAEFVDYAFLAYDWKSPETYGDLSVLLQVDYPPQTVLVDRKGVIQRIWNGYVDEGTLRQCLVNLGQS